MATPQEQLDDLGPKKVSGEQGAVEHHPLPDLIAARNDASAVTAADSAATDGDLLNRILRFARPVPPGA